MAKEQNSDMHGLGAFREAIKRQQGQFMRGATVILDRPKDMGASRKSNSTGERVAREMLNRSSNGQFKSSS